MSVEEEISKLEIEIAALEARLPKHSIPPSMILRLEVLEEELEILRARSSRVAAE